MAEEILRSRHAFGTVENLQYAVDNKLVDEHDVLFLKDKYGKAMIGWIDKNGEVVMVTDEKADLSKVEADVDALESNVDVLESEVAKKADAETVNAELDELNSGVAGLVADMVACEKAHEKVKYEVTDVPVGTLVKHLSNEIRIMCPVGTVFEKQAVGSGGDPDSYYMTFKTYVPNDNVVGYIEHLGDKVDNEILIDLKTDNYGRKYQPTWLSLAKCEKDGSWTYYGANSSIDKYIGWDYRIDWYDANGVMIASDSIRINLSNEDCHYTAEPYYVSHANAEIVEESKTYTDEQVAEVLKSMAIVEF